MEEFKTDRHALRWPKMRESKLVDFIRYTFQPWTGVFSFLGSTVSIIASAFGFANIAGLYFLAMTVILFVNWFKWRLYNAFKGRR